mmetsp:Transcript_147132/g.256983  ORF Transcript_147132/g.256983 Transcript_147132/m.256983 type:complete len:201 (+) Transcript_147132:1471-2073(+)
MEGIQNDVWLVVHLEPDSVRAPRKFCVPEVLIECLKGNGPDFWELREELVPAHDLCPRCNVVCEGLRELLLGPRRDSNHALAGDGGDDAIVLGNDTVLLQVWPPKYTNRSNLHTGFREPFRNHFQDSCDVNIGSAICCFGLEEDDELVESGTVLLVIIRFHPNVMAKGRLRRDNVMGFKRICGPRPSSSISPWFHGCGFP